MDYIDGDQGTAGRSPLTETIDKIEIPPEKELADTDVRLEQAEYDRKMGIHRVRVASKGTDSFGKAFSDENGRLTLSFMAKLPRKQTVLTQKRRSTAWEQGMYMATGPGIRSALQNILRGLEIFP